MDSLVSAVIVGSIAVHALLLLYVQVRRSYIKSGHIWLSLTIILSALVAAVYLLPDSALLLEKLGRGFGLALILAAVLTAYGEIIISDVQRVQKTAVTRLWLVLGLVWIAALVVSALVSETVTIGQAEWLVTVLTFTSPNVVNYVMLGGLALVSAILLWVAFRAFYVAALPEIANRGLFWVIDIALILIGTILTISGTPALVLVGLVSLPAGVIGAVYAQVSYRVFDIRTGLSIALRAALLVGITAIFIFIAIFTANQLNIGNNTEGGVLLGLLALVVALVYVPVRHITEAIITPILRGSFIDPTRAARQYSQQVSQAVELDQLVRVASETLNHVLGARRSGLLLVIDSGSAGVDLRVMTVGGFADARDTRGHLSKTSPIYHRLAAEKAPLSQFDLEFGPRYRKVIESERQFFSNLQMSAFAPVIVENVLIGILACGPKVNDAPFYQSDLELLVTMANQTGVALRNARLVADVQHLNRSLQTRNSDLEEANQRMERLDSVKTDFVTIASHELRTPLAQIRGYTDILDALNEQGMLDQDQIGGMVSNLRKATERTEELIAAMLDVSQLDVDAMDLRFTQTTPESVVRLAIEPLTDNIKQRKLTLSARGLRGLPSIEADMQRLVQAIRNIVVNAIKFTPDGGRIEITASLQPPDNPGDREHVLIAISDTGVGISKDNLELVFEKFYRAYDPGLHSTGTYKFMGAGPGLGLTIARGVIEGHGGKIWAESPGHNMETCPGTTFYILLPVSPPEDARRVLPFEAQTENN